MPGYPYTSTHMPGRATDATAAPRARAAWRLEIIGTASPLLMLEKTLTDPWRLTALRSTTERAVLARTLLYVAEGAAAVSIVAG